MSIPVIPEYIQELARAVGNAHLAITNGVGGDFTPGSALFELGQLSDLANYQLPRFGVISHSPSFFAVTPDTNPYFVLVSGGQIGYNQQTITIAPQRISVARNFGPILSTSLYDTYQYGVVIGFPMGEAEKSSNIYSTVVSQNANIGDSRLYVANTSAIANLGFPIAAYVNVSYVLFSGIDSTTGALIVDQSFNGGQLTSGATLGAPVNFVYTPQIRSLCGLPVSSGYQSNNDPALFSYYPPLPADWLPIAQLLMTCPRNPSLVITSGNTPAIASTVVSYPSPTSSSGLFSATNSPVIMQAVNSAYTAINNIAQSTDVSTTIRALQNYTAAIANNSTVTFRQYWASQPFTATSYYGVGVSFDSVERFEFADGFIQAYYDLTGTDLQHTYAIFRGDLYSGGNRFALTSPTVSANTYIANGVTSTLTKGTYIYGISTVTNTGESSPNYVSAISNSTSGNYYINELLWTQVTNALYYNIYRKATTVGEQQEYCLTVPNQITGSELLNTALTPPSFTQSYAISHLQEAMKFTSASGGIQHIGGIGLVLKTSTLFSTTNTNGLTISLYSDSAGPNSLLSTGTTILYSNLTTSFSTYYTQMDYDLQPNTSYWIVIGQTNGLPSETVSINVLSSDNSLFANNNGSGWVVSGNDGYYILLNFIDCGRSGEQLTSRGVKLTGKTSLVPNQLSVYVPPLDSSLSGLTSPTDITSVDPITGFSMTSTQNDMVVTVTARLGVNGTPTVLPSVTIPQGTARGYRTPLGTSSQIFDRIDDVKIVPGANLRLGAQNTISWSFYDFITIETTPT